MHGQPPARPPPRRDEWPCFRPAQSMHHHPICEFKCERPVWIDFSRPDACFFWGFFCVEPPQGTASLLNRNARLKHTVAEATTSSSNQMCRVLFPRAGF